MKPYLSYQIGLIKFATPIEEIKEVARAKNISVEDKLPRNIAGFFELRGKKICIFDLASFLDIKADEGFEIIITEAKQHYVGFKVEKILGIVSADEVVPYPEVVQAKDYLMGIITYDKELLQVISFYKILSGPRLKAIQKYL
ncbi:MAG: chemotaxis protein CheW [bacterium]